MAIAFNCPHCGELHRVKDELAGRTGKCKSAKCKQPILIPYRSTISSNGAPADAAPRSAGADELAAAAFAEEAPPVQQEKVAVGTIKVPCPACGESFEVEATMAGKNVLCRECGKVIRVPMPQAEKAVDWRQANAGRPSLAKVTEPAPAGAWDIQRKGVSGQAIREAGAHVVEDEDDIRERKFRRIKQAIYGLAFLGVVAFAVIWFMRSRTERKQERWMEQAVQEIEDKNEGSNRPEYQAAIHRFALEYFVRAAQNREQLEAAAKHFDKALSGLQGAAGAAADREAMLAELSLALVACSGDQKELDEDRRLRWDRLQKMMRQALEKIPTATHSERCLRQRAFRMLARKLAEKNQETLALNVAKNSCSADEYGNIAGRIGIEFFLMNKREAAQQVLGRASETEPELTALWMALNPDSPLPKGMIPYNKGVTRESRLAHAEGTALRGNIQGGQAIAVAPGPTIDRIDAMILVASVAIETGKTDEAGGVIDAIIGVYQGTAKEAKQSPWQMHRIVELCARANKMDKAQVMLDAMQDPVVRGWAKLELLRLKLAGQAKQKADEQYVDELADPPGTTLLSAAIARAEVARHNAAAGETGYTRSIESWSKGSIRPFGFAGTALGRQDRK